MKKPEARDTPAQTYRLPVFVKELLAGGAAGAVSKTTVAPLERVKILIQTGKVKTNSVAAALRQIYAQDGAAGLFRGNSASVLRIVPYAAIHFTLYEHYRTSLVSSLWPHATQHAPSSHPADHSHLPPAALPSTEVALTGPQAAASASNTNVNDNVNNPVRRGESQAALNENPGGGAALSGVPRVRVPPWVDLLAGSAAGATAVIVTYPLDLVRTRLAWSPDAGRPVGVHTRPAIVHAVHRVVQQHGIAGLYQGLTPTLLGILPYAGLKFYVYQTLKGEWRQRNEAAGGLQGGAETLMVPLQMTLLFGAAADPLDLIRRQMQVHNRATSSGPMSMAHLYRATVSSHGHIGLFKGLSINYLKVTPATAVGFAVYDYCKSSLGLQNNL